MALAESSYKKQMAPLYEEVELLRQMNEDLKQTKDLPLQERNVDGEIREKTIFLETDNLRLKEKNEFLQYELTKVKAQASGLQRICDNFRKRAEEEQSRPFAWQPDGDQIRKRSALLQQGLQEFRALNAVLLKKENLTQYEIEKNSEQISDLENIYSDLCQRLSRVGIKEDDLILQG